MGKNIILLSDGTGNSAAKKNKTNVWRLYESVDLHRSDQIAFYDDGVGSQEFTLFKILGGAFGWGLKRNVRELYKYLCRNYKDGDRIYLFGFSRGAFTVRMLAGMIAHCGVYTGTDDQKTLDRVARDNYNAFRDAFKRGLLTRLIRLFFRKSEVHVTHRPGIEFIGVWDTVDAYGMPVDELAGFWDWVVYQIRFPDFNLWEKVKKACHAISIDDERHTFHPVLWDESKEADPERIEQVWFPGVHSDVGGGYPKFSLALVTLDWMISKCEAVDSDLGAPGLHLIAQRRDEFYKHSDWHGPQHDSRAKGGVYYRYKPRDIEVLCNVPKKKIRIARPKIHRSVMERIAGNVIPYAPTGLPADYDVVSTRRELMPVYESQEEAVARKTAMAPVKSVIAFRRTLYFTMLGVTLAVLTSPGWDDRFLSGIHLELIGILDWFLKAMATWVLPDFTSPWVATLREHPVILYALIGVLIIFMALKAKAWQKTLNIANRAWAALKSKVTP